MRAAIMAPRCQIHVLCCWLMMTALPTATAETGADVAAVAKQIAAIYEIHAPDKLTKVPGLMQKYAGAEDALLLSVQEKYGVSAASQADPSVEQKASTGGQHLEDPVATAGAFVDLPGAIGQLHTRKLGIGDMRGLFGDAALVEFQSRWGAAPMLAKTVHEPSSVSRFFSMSVMHALLAGNKAPKSVYARDGFDFDKNLVPSASSTSPPSPFAVYLAGGTVFMNFVERHYPPVAALTCWLSEALGTKAQTNAYLTPPSAQGFTAHTDSQDVLILQLEGVKSWRVYHPRPIDNPFEKHMIRDAGNALRWGDVASLLRKPQPPIITSTDSRSSHKSEAEHVLGSPVEYLLQPGDVLYVPRGSPHEAFTPAAEGASENIKTGSGNAGGSLHLTLGLVTESDARYWMIRNQLLALCKQRRQPGISCAGHVGEALIALKDDPIRGGWVRGSPPFGWATNTTMRTEEFDRIWSHLARELPSLTPAVAAADVATLRSQMESSVNEQAVIDQEHTGFLAAEMALCSPSSLTVPDALRYKPPVLRGRGAASSGTGGKGVATLDTCLAFLSKATLSLSENDPAATGATHTLHLKAGARGGGRRAAKKAKTRLPIANKQAVEAIKFVTERQQQDCNGACARGFVVGALPGRDAFTKLALAQTLVKHGVVTVEETVDVYIDTAGDQKDQEAAFTQADTLCNLSVQQRDAESSKEEL